MEEKPGIILNKSTILMKPKANFCMIFPDPTRKLFQN